MAKRGTLQWEIAAQRKKSHQGAGKLKGVQDTTTGSLMGHAHGRIGVTEMLQEGECEQQGKGEWGAARWEMYSAGQGTLGCWTVLDGGTCTVCNTGRPVGY